MQCSSCGSHDIDFNESAGHAVCVVCGTVLEENTIVSSIEFQEAGDRSQIVGQFVSGNCSQPYSAGPRGRGRYGFSRDSRDATLANARRVISQVVSSLRLPSHYVDKAIRLYSLALQRSFLYGRRQVHVVAAVIYTVARQESSPHLLIDFSDMLQVNVYVLGQCFLQLTRLLSLHLQIIDPSLYIHRFAARLDLGSGNVAAVAVTALRAIMRMKRDWMSTGRRPDGLCAAALLIAARAHGFDRGIQDMATVFRISVNTIAKRLQEFRLTPSAQMTVSQFHQHPLQRPDAAAIPEFDPPAYVQNILDESLQLQMAAAGAASGGLGGNNGMAGLAGAGEVSVPVFLDAAGTGAGGNAIGAYNDENSVFGNESGEAADGAMVMRLSSRPKVFSYAKSSRNMDRRRLYDDIYTEMRAPLEAAAAVEASSSSSALFLDAGLEAELGAIQAAQAAAAGQSQSQGATEGLAPGGTSALRGDLIARRLQALTSEAEDVSKSVLFGQNRTYTVQLPSYAADLETPALMRLRAGLMKRRRANRLVFGKPADAGDALGILTVQEAAAAALKSSHRHLRDGSEPQAIPSQQQQQQQQQEEVAAAEEAEESDTEEGDEAPKKRSRVNGGSASFDSAAGGASLSSSPSAHVDPLAAAASLDPEVAALILGEEESLKRKQIWDRMHGSFIAERDARAAQKERDASKKAGGGVRKSTGDATSGSNVRVSYAAAAIITGATQAGMQGKKPKIGTPSILSSVPGIGAAGSSASSAAGAAGAGEASAVSVVPRKAAPKKVNFDALQGMLDEKGNFVKPRSQPSQQQQQQQQQQQGGMKREGSGVAKPFNPRGGAKINSAFAANLNSASSSSSGSGIDAAASAILELISPLTSIVPSVASSSSTIKATRSAKQPAPSAASAALSAAARATSAAAAASRLLKPVPPAVTKTPKTALGAGASNSSI